MPETSQNPVRSVTTTLRQMLLLLAMFAGTGSAMAAEPLQLADAIRQALANRPDLTLNRIDSAMAETETQRIEGMLDPVTTASIGVIDDKSPVASSFQASRTVTSQLQAGINKPLANGDTVGASIAYNQTRQTFGDPLAAQFALVNPAYRGQIDLTYRHPLLLGSDRPDYGDALQAARSDTTASRLQRRTIARSLALQVTNAYYQLASDRIQADLARQSVERAERLLKYQSFRERFGLIEASDRMQAKALLEARRLDLAQAKAQMAIDTSALNRLLLAPSSRDIVPSVPEPGTGDAVSDFDAVLASAKNHRPEFAILEAQLAAAEARLRQALARNESQLDVVAQLGTRSLNTQASTAASNAFGVNNHYASLSLEYSDPLGRNATRADIRKAELARGRVVEEQRQTLEQVRDDVSRTRTSLQSNIPAYRQATVRVTAERKKLETELQRYREGRSDTATIVQFEGDLSAAERQKELLAVTLALAEKQLAWAEGTLLDGLSIRLDDLETNE